MSIHERDLPFVALAGGAARAVWTSARAGRKEKGREDQEGQDDGDGLPFGEAGARVEVVEHGCDTLYEANVKLPSVAGAVPGHLADWSHLTWPSANR